MKGGGGEVEKRKDQGEESSSNRDEARSPLRYINFHRSRSLRAFFTITHPFYPRLPILYNSRDVPRNNNFSPSLQNSLSLISRNETSNFFRPLHLLSLSVPAETADKMASRDVSFVSFVLVSPPHRLQNLFTSSFGLLAPFTATAGKPRNKSRHRFFPPSNDSLRR